MMNLLQVFNFRQCQDRSNPFDFWNACPWLARISVFVLGGILTFAFSPISYPFIAIISVSPIFIILREVKDTRSAFWVGWCFAFGCYTASMYWISFSFGVDLQAFAWLIPFTVFGLPAYFALFPGLAAALAYITARDKPLWWLALSFALLWSIMEYARGIALTGFPWSLLGYIWSDTPIIMQLASVVGAYGISFFTILWISIPFVLLYRKGWRFVSNQIFALLALITLILTISYGIGRLNQDATGVVPNVKLRLVQPNIPQKLKMDRSRILEIYEILLALSQLPGKESITHVIWPEAALSVNLIDDEIAREHVARAAPKDGYLLLGALRREGEGNNFKIYNSFFILDAMGNIRSIYDKSHLVPFGEYVPLRFLLPKDFKKLTLGSVDFSEGTGVQSIAVPGAPLVSPLICYEGIFPGYVMPEEKKRPEWLLNITNDAWFGNTFGPYQHLAITQSRAIEEGVPLIRVANTGISAVVDPYGRVLTHLPLNERGVLDVLLPKNLELRTFYSLFGNLLLPFLILCYGILVFARLWSNRRNQGE